jgi:type II secretion system protein H
MQARSKHIRGFTLIELILVMVILCTVLGMAGPSLRGFFAQRQLEDAAASIMALAQLAKSQAVCEGRTYRLNLDTRDRTYWLTVQDQGAFRDLLTDWGRVFLLPPEVDLRVWDLDLDGRTYYAEFSSLGRCTPGTIQLISPKGDVLSMACRSATESFAIWEGKELAYETER